MSVFIPELFVSKSVVSMQLHVPHCSLMLSDALHMNSGTSMIPKVRPSIAV